MSAIASIAQSGLQAAQQRLNASAHNVANQQTEGFRRQHVAQQAVPEGGVTAKTVRGQQGVALEQEAVEQISASYAYLANLQVLRTNDRMQGALLDERA
ncbi:flagellar basal body protein [Comamonas terrigena]|uniref:flagellar basal body protein n=1 Tax=Comamonas terrigena TaxID=32013 RepID=UPI0028A6DFFD|nr:flagellar basal body protein [Comamonas terrigena]